MAIIGRVRCKRITHSPFTSALRVLCPDAEFVFLSPHSGILPPGDTQLFSLRRVSPQVSRFLASSTLELDHRS